MLPLSSGELAPNKMEMLWMPPPALELFGIGRPKAFRIGCGLDVRILVVVEAVLVVDLHAFEILLHDEVDDAGDGVRTVHSRRAAGDHVDPVDQGGRNVVEVGNLRARVTGHQALAVDQNQGAVRTEAAKVGLGRAVGTVGDLRRLGREGRRQIVQQRLDVARAGQLDFGAGHRGQRADAGEVWLRNTRTGDDQLLDRIPARTARGVGLCDRGGAGDRAGGAEALQTFDKPAPADRDDNLWAPRTDAIESEQDVYVRRQSLWLEAQLRPGLTLGLMGAAALAGVGLLRRWR